MVALSMLGTVHHIPLPINEQPQLRQRLLKHAALKLVYDDRCDLSLQDVANLANVDINEAKAHFADDDGMLKGLEEHVYAELFRYAEAEKAKADSGIKRDLLRAVLTGYFRFSVEEPDLFQSYLAFEGGSCELLQLTGLDALSTRPYFKYVLQHVQEVSVELGGPQDPATLMMLACTVLGTVHGYAHLCLYGAARHLVDSAKMQTLAGMLDTLCVGVTPIFMGGVMRAVAPRVPLGPMKFKTRSVGPAVIETDEDKRKAIINVGIQLLRSVGIENFDLRSAAAAVGISSSEAHRLFDGNRAYFDHLEEIFEANLQRSIDTQVRAANVEGQPINELKASGFGALAAALTNPDGLLGLIQTSSGTIIPSSRDAEEQLEGASVSFRTTYKSLNKAFYDSGVETTPWDLYLLTFTAWAACHGAIHLTALNAGASMHEQLKHLIVGTVLDVALLSIIESHGLKLAPGSIVPFSIEKRFERFTGEEI